LSFSSMTVLWGCPSLDFVVFQHDCVVGVPVSGLCRFPASRKTTGLFPPPGLPRPCPFQAQLSFYFRYLCQKFIFTLI
jgi:hypothetical protein